MRRKSEEAVGEEVESGGKGEGFVTVGNGSPRVEEKFPRFFPLLPGQPSRHQEVPQFLHPC